MICKRIKTTAPIPSSVDIYYEDLCKEDKLKGGKKKEREGERERERVRKKERKVERKIATFTKHFPFLLYI